MHCYELCFYIITAHILMVLHTSMVEDICAVSYFFSSLWNRKWSVWACVDENTLTGCWITMTWREGIYLRCGMSEWLTRVWSNLFRLKPFIWWASLHTDRCYSVMCSSSLTTINNQEIFLHSFIISIKSWRCYFFGIHNDTCDTTSCYT